jgi:hypothetical protein
MKRMGFFAGHIPDGLSGKRRRLMFFALDKENAGVRNYGIKRLTGVMGIPYDRVFIVI